MKKLFERNQFFLKINNEKTKNELNKTILIKLKVYFINKKIKFYHEILIEKVNLKF